jgi:CheY-like chemotaxis protein
VRLIREAGIKTPIIGVSAHALKGDREKCLDAGMNAYLPKPFRPHELKEALDVFCRKAP